MKWRIIGLDLDNPSEFKLLKTVFNAMNIGEIEIYETKPRHYHIYIKLRRQVEWEENKRIRMALNDDAWRIIYDELRPAEWRDTLFQSTRKNGRIRLEEPVDLKNILSLPFTSKICRSVIRKCAGKR